MRQFIHNCFKLNHRINKAKTFLHFNAKTLYNIIFIQKPKSKPNDSLYSNYYIYLVKLSPSLLVI